MDMNRLTQRSQEALQEAQSIAIQLGQTEVDTEHLLRALISDDDGLAPRLFGFAGVDTDALRGDVDAELRRRPSVSGPGPRRARCSSPSG